MNFITNTTSQHQITTFFSDRVLLSSEQATLLGVISILVLLLNIILNITTLTVITITNQFHETTSRIIFYLSISDCGIAVSRVSLVALIFDHNRKVLGTNFELASQFTISLVSYFSAYTVTILAYDRLLHIKHLNNYSMIMNTQKMDKIIFAALFVACFQPTSLTIETIYPNLSKLKVIRLAFNIIIMIGTIGIYLTTIKVMKTYRSQASNQELLERLDKTVTVLATIYLVSIIIFYTPILVISFMKSILTLNVNGQKAVAFSFHLAMVFAQLNTIVNAVIFLRLNRKSRQVFRKISVKWKKNEPE